MFIGFDERSHPLVMPSSVGEVDPGDEEEAGTGETTTEDDAAKLPEGQASKCLGFVSVNVFVDLHFKGHDYASPVTFFAIFVAENRMKMRTTGATKNMPKLLPMNSQSSCFPGSRLSPVHDPMSAW